jgi:predicted DNA-binding transcriptional regulator YafY
LSSSSRAQGLRCLPVLEVEGFSTSSRTIERDLKALSQQFPLIAETSSKPYGWSWAKEANFEFTPRLSASQGVALLLSRMHLRNLLPRSMLSELTPIFEQAEKVVAPTGWKDWHLRTAVLPTSLTTLSPRTSPGVLETVHHALVSKRCLAGRYRSKGSQEAKDMKIHPLGLLMRGNIQYLVCTLREYHDIRHLALHRFDAVSLLDEPCRPPDAFDFHTYVVGTGSKYRARGDMRLVARFSAVAAEHLRDAPISNDQTLAELEDSDRVELSASVENDETLRWWLLGFGSHVEVMQPASLREELRIELANTLRHYSSMRAD